MDAKRFFDLIWPSIGERCMAVPSSKGLQQFFGSSNQWAADMVRQLDGERQLTVYHACATFKDKFSRKAENVLAVKSFWMDIDVGERKPYGTFKEGVAALITFCETVGITRPFIIKSGVGLHAYWPLDHDVTPREWKVCSELLKEAGKRAGLGQDTSRTSDIASILRPVGSTHRKGEPKPVQLAVNGKVTTLAEFQSPLATWLSAEATADTFEMPAGRRPAGSVAAMNADLSGGMEYAPKSAAKVAERCAVVRLMRNERGNVDQPTWYNVLGVMAHCVDGIELAHEWSSGHPQYTRAETDTKLDQQRRHGPTTCSKLSDCQPNLCASCPQWGSIKSPIVLGADSREPSGSTFLIEDIERYRLSNLQRQPLYKLRPIHEGLCYRGEVALLVSRGGQAKSTYAIGVALAVATGQPLLGVTPGPQGTALVINAEDPRGWLRTQFYAACQRHGISTPHDVLIFGQEDADGLALTEINPTTRREQVSVGGIQALSQLIALAQPRFVVLDPLTALVPYGANDNGVMAAVMKSLKGIAARLDCAIMLIAHTRKGADVALEGAEITLGASAITNLARAVWAVQTPSPEASLKIGAPLGRETAVRELIAVKANRRALPSSTYFMIEGVLVPNATSDYPQPDEIGVAVPFTPSHAANQLPQQYHLDALTALAKGTPTAPFSPAPQAGSRYFGQTLVTALAPHFSGANPGELTRKAKYIYGELKARGWVDERLSAVSRNSRKGVWVLWGATPWATSPDPGPYCA